MQLQAVKADISLVECHETVENIVCIWNWVKEEVYNSKGIKISVLEGCYPDIKNFGQGIAAETISGVLKSDIEQMFDRRLEDEYWSELAEGVDGYCNTFDAYLSDSNLQSEIASFIYDCSEYSAGAAHPGYFTKAYHFNADTGTQITFEEIMVDPYAYEKLGQLVYEEILLIRDSEVAENGKERVVNYLSREYDSFKWYLSPAGLKIIFDPYAISHYADGTIVAEIPYESLNGIVKQQYLVHDTLKSAETAALKCERIDGVEDIHAEQLIYCNESCDGDYLLRISANQPIYNVTVYEVAGYASREMVTISELTDNTALVVRCAGSENDKPEIAIGWTNADGTEGSGRCGIGESGQITGNVVAVNGITEESVPESAENTTAEADELPSSESASTVSDITVTNLSGLPIDTSALPLTLTSQNVTGGSVCEGNGFDYELLGNNYEYDGNILGNSGVVRDTAARTVRIGSRNYEARCIMASNRSDGAADYVWNVVSSALDGSDEQLLTSVSYTKPAGGSDIRFFIAGADILISWQDAATGYQSKRVGIFDHVEIQEPQICEYLTFNQNLCIYKGQDGGIYLTPADRSYVNSLPVSEPKQIGLIGNLAVYTSPQTSSCLKGYQIDTGNIVSYGQIPVNTETVMAFNHHNVYTMTADESGQNVLRKLNTDTGEVSVLGVFGGGNITELTAAKNFLFFELEMASPVTVNTEATAADYSCVRYAYNLTSGEVYLLGVKEQDF